MKAMNKKVLYYTKSNKNFDALLIPFYHNKKYKLEYLRRINQEFVKGISK